MIKIFLGLGSNMGDKERNIQSAVELLGEKIFNIQLAPLYTSKAWGVTDQPDFVNTAMSGDTDLDPEDLLTFVKAIEQQVGRVERFRWGPREIDIDVIFYGDIVYKSEKLHIPHAGAHERDSVLVPLSELDPEYLHPIYHKSVQALLNEIHPQNRSIISRIY